jgi:hypothetical protein
MYRVKIKNVKSGLEKIVQCSLMEVKKVEKIFSFYSRLKDYFIF